MSYRTLFLIIVFLLIPIVLLLRLQQRPKTASAEWFNDSWTYRQAINISSHTAAESNVFVTASINIGTTTKSQVDNGDFRFTTQSGQLLSYYRSSGVGTTSITFHIQLESFPAGAQTLYAYYGNPSADNGYSNSDFSPEASSYSIGSYSSEETGGGPVAYWKFDEGVGSTAYDSGSNRLNGRLMANTSWVTEDKCISGKCLFIDDVGTSTWQSVQVQDNVALGNMSGLTVSMWLKTVENKTTQQVVYKRNSGASPAWYSYQFVLVNLKPSFYVANAGGTVVTAQADSAIELNKWYHLTGVYNGSQVQIYVDTRAADSTPASLTGNVVDTDYSLMIGGLDAADSYYLHGFLDDVKIYPYARSTAQIKQDYLASAPKGAAVQMGSSSLKSLSDGLIAYYKFDEGTGTTSVDSSGNSYTATFGATAPSWGTGKFGTGTTFSTNTYISVGSTISSIYSLSLWYYPTNTAPQFLTFNNSSIDIGATANTISAIGVSSPIIYVDNVISSSIGSTNTWHHLVVTSTSPVTGNQINFGKTSSLFLNGRLDEIRFYNRTLTKSEVEDLYQFAPGPVAYWNFDEGVGTTAYDTSGNGNNGALGTGTSSPSWSTGKIGKALKFDGSNDYVSVGSTVNTIDSISFWVKPTTTSQYLLDLDGGTHYISVSSGVVSATGFSSPTIYINGIGTSSGLTANTWSHIAITTSTAFNATSITFGKSTTNFLNGTIDDVRIYNYARSQKQIIEDMNAGRPAASANSMIAHYKFDEGQGTTPHDSSPNSNHATSFYGSPQWTNDGKFGKALTFTGVGGTNGDYVIVPYSSSLNIFSQTNWTVSLWAHPRSGNTNNYTVIQGTSHKPRININTTTASYQGYVGSTFTTIISTSGISVNQWNHVVFLGNGTNNKIYINGIEKASAAYQQLDSPPGAIRFGASGWNQENFIGDLDEIKFYNYALTADEVKTDYNQGASLVAGSSNQTIGSTTTSLDYCIPGDTSTCSPPIAEWKMDEGVGTIIYDTSGTGNTGTFGSGSSAPTWSTGKIGKGLKSDGNDTVNVTGLTATGGNYTFEFWAKPDTVNASGYDFFIDMLGDRFVLGRNTTNFQFYDGSWKDYSPAVAHSPYLNSWHYYSFVFNASNTTAYIYIDGQLKSSNATYISKNISSTIALMSRYDNTNYQMKGYLDQFRIYNYARTPAQIALDYNRGGPVGWWKLDECQGSTAYDSSGIGNTGSISIGASGTQNTLGTCSVGTSAAWTNGATGKWNSSLNFDGSDDYIGTGLTIPAAQTSTQGISYSAWVKTTQSSDAAIVGMDHNSGCTYFCDSGIQININSNSGKAVFVQYSAVDGYKYVPSTTAVNNDTWHHIIGLRKTDGTTQIYVDGRLENSGSMTSYYSNSTRSNIGTGDSRNKHFFSGLIDDVRIYNYALTATQIKTLYNGGAVNFR